MADRSRRAVRSEKRGLLALFFCLLLVACQPDREHVYTLSGQTMGTTWSVKTVGLPAGTTLPALQQDLMALLVTINNQMSTYQDDAEISRYNRLAAGQWQQVSADFMAVLSLSLELAGQTGGAYDPTVGPLVNAWGFGPGAMRLQRPDDQVLEDARARVGYQRVQVDRDKQAVLQPGGVYLDFSSVAKGYAVDKLADFLDARGQQAYLVEIGGELRAAGHKPDGSAWRIAVEQPVPGIRETGRVLELVDMAVATSGDYRNFFTVDGVNYPHIIDPRTGLPVGHGTGSVTVLHPRCAHADALATALSVLGPEQGLAFARERNLAVLFVVREDDGFQEVRSPAFEALVTGGAHD